MVGLFPPRCTSIINLGFACANLLLYEYLVINSCLLMQNLRLKLINLWETFDAASYFHYTKFVVVCRFEQLKCQH
jgi:hypothetical protein